MTPEQEKELEEVKKRFEIGKHFQFTVSSFTSDLKEVFLLIGVELSPTGKAVLIDFNGGRFDPKYCTPCVVGVWRCCEMEKPDLDRLCAGAGYGATFFARHKTQKHRKVAVYHDYNTRRWAELNSGMEFTLADPSEWEYLDLQGA